MDTPPKTRRPKPLEPQEDWEVIRDRLIEQRVQKDREARLQNNPELRSQYNVLWAQVLKQS